MFKFNIDKEANFVYWAQLMCEKWCWFFDAESYNFFKNISKNFSETEQAALNKFKSIIQKENNQFYWIWQRYGNRPILDEPESKIFLETRRVLADKFDELWDQEFPKLIAWQKQLESYDFKRLDLISNKVINFLGGKNIEGAVTIKLLLGVKTPFGASRFDFPDLLILNISNAQESKINSAVGIALHEFFHIINTRNGLVEKLLSSQAKTVENFELKDGYQWKYIFTETILRSIAGHRSNNYLGALLDFTEEERKADSDLSHKKPLGEYGYEFIIRIAASKIFPETKKYLDTHLVIDQKYIECVSKIWLELMKEMSK